MRTHADIEFFHATILLLREKYSKCQLTLLRRRILFSFISYAELDSILQFRDRGIFNECKGNRSGKNENIDTGKIEARIPSSHF